jgi:hypothetical protein
MKILSIIFLVLSSSIIAQSLADYYPLQIGNKWIYKSEHYEVSTIPSVSYSTIEIVGDTVMGNGLKYYTIGHNIKQYLRFDTLTNEIKYWELSGCPGNDVSKYSLNFVKDSTVIWKSCDQKPYKISFRQLEHSDTSCIDLDLDWLVAEKTSFKKYVGIISQSFREISYINKVLIGSRINGKEWGQLTSVSNDNDLEFNYKLEQNYPNPFNPTTTIEFTITKSTRARVNIFNSIGQRISTVYEKEILGGKHKVVFDGSNYASGVYFYQLITDDYQSVKKLTILK